MALLSRMSAPELQLDIGVQHSVKKLIQKSQEAASSVISTGNANPVHNFLHSTNALSHLDAAFTLVTPKQCEILTSCEVNDLYNHLVQTQEAAANALYFLQKPLPSQLPPPLLQPVQGNRRN
jgi:hypothetical protein